MAIRVLIVDDHSVLAEGLRHLIDAQDDLEVVGCAGDGRTALRMAAELKPDLVLMDISMPELGGIEAARLIHERAPAVQVVMLSMHMQRDYVLRALRAGARGYLLKQSAGAEIPAAIRAVHMGRRYLSAEIAESVIDEYLRIGSGEDPLDALSSRERQVLQMLTEGHATGIIAQALSLSPKTVETYRARIMHKLGIANMQGLVKFAIQQGLTTVD